MVVGIIVVAVVALVAVAVLAVRAAAVRARRRIDDRLAGLIIERRDKANFYGLRSEGTGQVRGIGILVLTPRELRFIQLVPDRELRIARSALTGVGTVGGFLGKTQGRELLHVSWLTADGEEEEAAWDVPGLDTWQKLLRAGT